MASNFKLRSTAFESGEAIPQRYTCDGPGVSPALSWTTPPEGTRSLALVADDPDAPGPQPFVHWLLFNLPPDQSNLPEDLDPGAQLATDGGPQPVFGTNGFGDAAYGTPCPPTGDDPHGYSFRLYALDATLDLGEGVSKEQLTEAMDGHVLAEADLLGTYQRSA